MSCQEEMVQAQRGKVSALAGAWGEAKVKAEAGWVARFRPAPTGSAYAPNAGTKPPMSPDNPAFIEVVPSAAHP
jgi:hypothetical protein